MPLYSINAGVIDIIKNDSVSESVVWCSVAFVQYIVNDCVMTMTMYPLNDI